MSQIEDYEKIADAYEGSMRLPFRDAVEQYTLMGILGDVTGVKAVDMACGDGFYGRLLKRAGASDVLGIDASAEMVRRAEKEERRNPLGCTYRQAEVVGLELAAPVDVVVGMYLLGYARTAEQLRGFCQACHAVPHGPAPRRTVRRRHRRYPEPRQRRVEEVRSGEDVLQVHRPRATKSGTPLPTPTASASRS